MGAFTRALSNFNHGVGFAAPVAKYTTPGTAVGSVVHGLESYGAGRLFGYVHGMYREKASLWGVPANLLAGIGLKVAAIGAALVTDRLSPTAREPWWASHLETIGNAGIAAFGFAQGVADGTKSSGRKIIILPKGAAAPTLPAGSVTDVVGEIPPAAPGRYLDLDQLQTAARSI